MTVIIDGTTGVNTPAVSGMTTPLSVGQGGTGLTTATGVLVGAGSSVSAVAAGTNGNVLTSNGTTWVSQAAGGTAPVYTVATTPGTWTKPATVKAIKVTVVGGGGAGGNSVGGAGAGGFSMYTACGGGGGGGAAIKLYPAPSLPGPQPYTVGAAGATSSFGVAPAVVVSATAGTSASPLTSPGSAQIIQSSGGGAGGVGSNGDINIGGGGGGSGSANSSNVVSGNGGSSILGGGGVGSPSTGGNAGNYGAGGGGGARAAVSPSPGTAPGGTGSAGVIIIEEFY